MSQSKEIRSLKDTGFTHSELRDFLKVARDTESVTGHRVDTGQIVWVEIGPSETDTIILNYNLEGKLLDASGPDHGEWLHSELERQGMSHSLKPDSTLDTLVALLHRASQPYEYEVNPEGLHLIQGYLRYSVAFIDFAFDEAGNLVHQGADAGTVLRKLREQN